MYPLARYTVYTSNPSTLIYSRSHVCLIYISIRDLNDNCSEEGGSWRRVIPPVPLLPLQRGPIIAINTHA